MKKLAILLVTCIMMVSCGGRNVRMDYISSTDLYIGWLDMKAWDVKKYGYKAQADWEKDIAAANGELKAAAAGQLKMYKVTGAAKMTDAQPVAGYVVQFGNVTLDPQAGLSAEVFIKDGAYGRIINKFTSKVAPSTSKEAFGAKVKKACKAVANDIYMQMTQ